MGPATPVTFQQYLDARIEDFLDEDPDLDKDHLKTLLANEIAHHGFTLDDTIPPGYEEMLAKHVF